MNLSVKLIKLICVQCLFVILQIIGCVCGQTKCLQPQALAAEYRISNSTVSLGICNRDAGAVCSIVYDGHEFINDFDHGRQMQVSWIYNDLGEASNPTEAGSADDFNKMTSTSKLLSVGVEGNTLTTENHPAYWLRSSKGGNTQPVTKDTLEKTITLGFGGDPHVIVLDVAVTISPELTGPPVKKIQINVPAFYTSSDLTEHYQLDRRDGAMVRIPPPARPELKDRQNERVRLSTDRQRIPILSSPDGRYAVGVYTPQAENFWASNSFSVPSDVPANACNKVSVRFEHAAVSGHTYSYRTFVIVGDLKTVMNAIIKLP